VGTDADASEGSATPGARGPDGATPDLATLDAAAADLLGESLLSYVSREDVEAALDPAASVASRDSAGGPAPGAVAASLDEATASLETDREAVAGRREAIDAAADELRTEVDEYV
jgi:argininosuccinate lyase